MGCFFWSLKISVHSWKVIWGFYISLPGKKKKKSLWINSYWSADDKRGQKTLLIFYSSVMSLSHTFTFCGQVKEGQKDKQQHPKPLCEFLRVCSAQLDGRTEAGSSVPWSIILLNFSPCDEHCARMKQCWRSVTIKSGTEGNSGAVKFPQKPPLYLGEILWGTVLQTL